MASIDAVKLSCKRILQKAINCENRVHRPTVHLSMSLIHPRVVRPTSSCIARLLLGAHLLLSLSPTRCTPHSEPADSDTSGALPSIYNGHPRYELGRHHKTRTRSATRLEGLAQDKKSRRDLHRTSSARPRPGHALPETEGLGSRLEHALP